jgi:hypothetical protein
MVWNDRLVVVGEFTRVGTGTQMLRSICESMWDGSAWSTFGNGSGSAPQPLAVTAWGSKLVVAGWVGSNSVSAWNGSAWTDFDPNMFPYAYAAIEHQAELYVGGEFTETSVFPPAVPVVLNGIGRWTGSDWAPLGSGLTASLPSAFAEVYTLASWNGLVAAGGHFDTAGGLPASNFALWNGTQWSAAGAGLDGDCYALQAWNGVLLAGGDFTHAGGLTAPGAAFWDGAAWHAMGDEAVEVTGFAQIAGTLYAVGDFRHPDGSVSNTVARWTGMGWALLGSGARAGSDALIWVCGYHGDLYAGGFGSFAFGTASHGIIRLPAANTVGIEDGPLATRVSLVASPNPGGRRMLFSFTLPQAGHARLAIYDATGRVVATLADGEMPAGRHEALWTAPASPGLYFARLEAPGGGRGITRFARIE